MTIQEVIMEFRDKTVYVADNGQMTKGHIVKIYIVPVDGAVEVKRDGESPKFFSPSGVFLNRADCALYLMEEERRRHLDNMAKIMDSQEEPKTRDKAHE